MYALINRANNRHFSGASYYFWKYRASNINTTNLIELHTFNNTRGKPRMYNTLNQITSFLRKLQELNIQIPPTWEVVEYELIEKEKIDKYSVIDGSYQKARKSKKKDIQPTPETSKPTRLELISND